jgi:hypothetical protein
MRKVGGRGEGLRLHCGRCGVSERRKTPQIFPKRGKKHRPVLLSVLDM